MTRTRAFSYVLPLVALFLVSACASGGLSKREAGALGGAALGAGAGAIIGNQSGNKAAGAAIGGALGALGGAVVGDQLEAKDQQLDRQQQQLAKNRELIEELKRRDLDARETRRGVVVNLPDVLFEFNRSDLTPGARESVGDIASVVGRPGIRERQISVEGHTDSVGSDEYNQRLSERRAEAVESALTRQGVEASRVRSRGFGERYPIAPNATQGGADNPAGRAKNRRVEVIIEN